MTMQYDVKASHLNESGFLTLNGTANRTRIKQVTYSGNASQSGTMIFFDTLTAPVSAVYSRTGATVTVTKSSHGLATGAMVGIGYLSATGLSATDGNYTITVTDANTFTITDPNSGSVSGGTTCYYVPAYTTADTRYINPNRWLMAFDTLTGATSTQQVIIPGEGVLVQNGAYVNMSYIGFVTAFYG
jgi:hypothetical protein